MLPSDSAVLVAAPPTLYRQGLLTTLRDTWPSLTFTIVPEAESLPDRLRRQAFAFVVVDSELPGPPLPELLPRLRAIRSQQPLLLLAPRLSAYSQQHLGPDARVRWLPRHAAPHDVVATIRPWLSGTTGGATSAAHALPRLHAPLTPLSRRELEVLRLVVGDCCNEEIAQQLCLSVRTVESHRRALLQKTGARTLVGLVVQAVREGWVL